jgi:hypothetical protein
VFHHFFSGSCQEYGRGLLMAQTKKRDRVIYYSENDFGFGPEYSKVNKRISDLLAEKYKLTLADVIELIEIKKYLNNPHLIQKHTESVEKINTVIGKWFSKIEDKQFVDYVRTADLPIEYEDVLWERIASQRLNDQVLSSLIQIYSGTRILFPLRQARVVKRFGKLCCDILVQTLDNISIILNSDSNRVILPTEFTVSVRSSFFMQYVQSDNPNPNYLEMIALDRLTSQETRIIAKTEYQKLIAKHFAENNGSTFQSETRVLIDSLLADDVDFEVSSKTINNVLVSTIKYNERVLDDLIDWPTILNNFIYEFGMVDDYGILSVAPRTEQGGIFERLFNKKADGQFQSERTLHTVITPFELSFIAYYRFLQAKGIRLESVLEWFFDKYLDRSFGIRGLNIKLPQRGDRDEIKPLLAMTQLHRIIRMYSLLALDFNFDRRLIDNFSSTPRFSQIPSAMEIKYASISDKILKNAEFYLFSDQAAMPSDDGLRFGDLVANNKVPRDSLLDFQIKVLGQLEQADVLSCEENQIKFQSGELYAILRADFQNGVIPYSRIISRIKKHPILDNLKSEGKLNLISTLLTDKEASVFDYYFSDVYSNGKGLRNIYAHGAFSGLKKEEHVGNYMITLMFIVFLVIKINDDLDEQSRLQNNLE